MQTVCNTYWDAGKDNLTAQNTKKPFGGRGSAPDPTEGAHNAPANPLVGGEGLAAPSQEPHPPSRPLRGSLRTVALRASTPTPHSKISSDTVGSVCIWVIWLCKWFTIEYFNYLSLGKQWNSATQCCHYYVHPPCRTVQHGTERTEVLLLLLYWYPVRAQYRTLTSVNYCRHVVTLPFLPRDAMRKGGLCCRPVSARHVGGLYPDG